MALTGLQIQKLLPKTNCKECGSNTCMAFAMKLAAKKAELSECPYASEEAKEVLGAASEPPVRTVKIGEKSVGGETVLYRHEKTFVNEPLLAVNVNDTDEGLAVTIQQIKDYLLERVGEELRIGAIAVTQTQDDAGKLLEAVQLVVDAGLPVLLRAKDKEVAKQAAAQMKTGGVICGVTKNSAAELAEIAKENQLVLGVTGSTIDEIGEITASVKDGGFNDMILELPEASPAQEFALDTVVRRAAFGSVKPMGYTFLRFIESDDLYTVMRESTTEIAKYGGVIVFPKFDIAMISTAMILRQNIYTDPQKPIQVEPGVYPIGEPDENSYVFLTTNFSLTYFLVSGEIENSGISAWLVIPECEGMSVLTAWAAGKFGGDMIAKFIKAQELEQTHKNKTIVIPGYVSQISGELQEGLGGDWKVLVGTQESSDIESYVKAQLS